jgi:hypothetical protein
MQDMVVGLRYIIGQVLICAGILMLDITLQVGKSKPRAQRSESEFLVNYLRVFLILFCRYPHLRLIRKQKE